MKRLAVIATIAVAILITAVLIWNSDDNYIGDHSS